jgi:hypothetical protein
MRRILQPSRLVVRRGRAVRFFLVAAVYPEQLEPSRGLRRRDAKIRRRRAAGGAFAALCVIAVIAVVVSRLSQPATEDPGAVASPVAASALDLGTRPPDRVIARLALVEIHLPVDRNKVALTLFRPVDDPDAAALEPDATWKHKIAPQEDRAGPSTAAVDIAAPPTTIVYSPVDGTISSVTPYVVAGQQVGYQVDISPEAQSDVVVRVRHIEGIPVDRKAGAVCDGDAGLDEPKVGEFVTAGVSCIGQVRDAASLTDIARPEIAKYVSGPGNHVHMEVVRVGS